jgi:hypothetical protein
LKAQDIETIESLKDWNWETLQKVTKLSPAICKAIEIQKTTTIKNPPEPTVVDLDSTEAVLPKLGKKRDLPTAESPSAKRQKPNPELLEQQRQQKAIEKEQREIDKLKSKLSKKANTAIKKLKFTSRNHKPVAEVNESTAYERVLKITQGFGEIKSDTSRMLKKSFIGEEIFQCFPELEPIISCKYTGKAWSLPGACLELEAPL